MLHIFPEQSAGAPSRIGRTSPCVHRTFSGGSAAVLSGARSDRVGAGRLHGGATRYGMIAAPGTRA
jgi:hypothetical protein